MGAVRTRWISFLLGMLLLVSLARPVSATQAEEPEDTGQETASEAGDPESPPASGDPETPEDPEGPETPCGMTLVTDRHIPFLYGSGGPFPSFHPWRNVTRAEAAQMLFRLLPEPPEERAEYADVPQGAWYAEAVRAIGALGVMGAGEETFRPGEEITREEFVRSVASFFPLETGGEPFPDVPRDSPNAAYILSARQSGWVQGNRDGLFCPQEPITRAQAAVLLNRALGRGGDGDYIRAAHPAFYLDVPPDSWFYEDVLEATVPHTYDSGGGQERWLSHTAGTDAPAGGFHLVDGWLYCYSEADGDILRNTRVGGLPFNAAGRFTSGNAELDGRLREIVLAQTREGMTREEMLRSLYLFVRDNKGFKYLRRPAYQPGASDFMEADALLLLKTGRGNCYCYASVFWYLARWIGYDAVIYSGLVGQNASPHAWVEINFDGVDYIFDAELEMSYLRKGRTDVNLYRFLDPENRWRYIRP